MRWDKDKYQITAPLDNRKHRNVGVVRSAPGIKQYLTSCPAIDQEFTTIAYSATTCMDCQAAEVTDDKASVETPKVFQDKSEKAIDGVRPVMPTEIEQIGEEIFKDKEPETILQDDNITVEEDFPTYAQDSQEFMHMALQVESSITQSYDKDGKARHAPKENNQDPDNHEQTTH
jgi:hypothetical protein